MPSSRTSRALRVWQVMLFVGVLLFWYVATHPSSHFVTSLVVARPEKAGRHVLHGTQYSFYSLTGEADKRQLNSVDEIKGVLEDIFRIRTAGVVGLDERLERLVSGVGSETSLR